jgi:membrane protease YdiL (CAAX protease family)
VILDALISSVFQVGIAFLLAGLAFWFSSTEQRFLEWVGLTRISQKAVLWGFGLMIAWTLTGFGIEWLIGGMVLEGHPVHKIVEAQPAFTVGLTAAAVQGGIKTGLAEELLFRGLIGKRLIESMGYRWGNLLQAGAFGGFHLLFIPLVPADWSWGLSIFLLFCFPAALGYIAGMANERIGEGSIIPGWIIHGGGNAVSYVYFFVNLAG